MNSQMIMAESQSADIPINVLTATARELQERLRNGTSTSVEIVRAYLDQIDRHNLKGANINAFISLAPTAKLLEIASELDDRRARGDVLSPLHGIPILVKDNIMTVDFDTTCGSFALKGVKVKANADVVDYVLSAGMIILGKTNLSEWAGKKGALVPGGWSAVGGQTQSPYIKGGFVKGDTFLGHSNPCGSSSGSAAGVAAGFAPLSLGTETDGSIIQPAGRNSVYGLKVTPGLISTKGTSPTSPISDSLGPMARSATDLATLLGILAQKDYEASLTRTWKDQKVAFVDPYLWTAPEIAMPLVPELLEHQRQSYLAAADLIEQEGGKVVRDAFLFQYSALEINGKPGIDQVWDHDFAGCLEEFLAGYENAPIKTLADLVRYNEEHADTELPEEFPGRQSLLEDALGEGLSDEDYDSAKVFLREKAQSGFDKIFSEHGVDILAMPQDCRVSTLSAAAGYPSGISPLGYSPINGRGYGIVVVAKAGREDKIVEFMAAWEATHPGLPQPPKLD